MHEKVFCLRDLVCGVSDYSFSHQQVSEAFRNPLARRSVQDSSH